MKTNEIFEKLCLKIGSFVVLMLVFSPFVLGFSIIFGFGKEFTDIIGNAVVYLNYGWWLFVIIIFTLVFCENIFNFFRGKK